VTYRQIEFSMFGKRLELLKEIAPGVKRAAVIRTAETPPQQSLLSLPQHA
jgi:hypothetical protein